MAIDFPNSPSINDTYTVDSRTWVWTGTAWRIVTASVGPTGPTGPSGIDGNDGPTGPSGLDGKFIVSSVAPVSPEEGDVWFNSNTGKFYLYFDSYWVETSSNEAGPTGPIGPTGPVGVFLVSETAPVSPEQGDVWFDSTTGQFFIWFDNVWSEIGPNLQGPAGVDGQGVPLGGSAGQFLSKASGTDYDTVWATVNQTDPIKLNENSIDSDYTIPAGYNGLSAGPITIADGVTVTISDGSAWSIV
jgi:hypothetical protein